MTYGDYLAADPVVITAAITVGVHGKEASPHLPQTPEEVAAAAEACEDARTPRRLARRVTRGSRALSLCVGSGL